VNLLLNLNAPLHSYLYFLENKSKFKRLFTSLSPRNGPFENGSIHFGSMKNYRVKKIHVIYQWKEERILSMDQ